VNLFAQAFAWIFSDKSPYDPISTALAVHLAYTGVSVLIAIVIAVPAGWAIGHTGRARNVAVVTSGAARALPSFGLFILLSLVMGVLHQQAAAVITFVLLALPSILAGAYSGFEAIDRRVVDAARSVGMTEWQILWRVEVPLGLPLLVAGIRSAVLQVIATVVIAAYVGLGGLGQYIIAGIPLQQFGMVLGSAIVVAALALVVDILFALLQGAVVPRGVRSARIPTSRRERLPLEGATP
jgi:osmoprotectant transport system permease protein